MRWQCCNGTAWSLELGPWCFLLVAVQENCPAIAITIIQKLKINRKLSNDVRILKHLWILIYFSCLHYCSMHHQTLNQKLKLFWANWPVVIDNAKHAIKGTPTESIDTCIDCYLLDQILCQFLCRNLASGSIDLRWEFDHGNYMCLNVSSFPKLTTLSSWE